MKIAPVDWYIIAGYIVFAVGIGIIFARRASKNINEFFISGRNLPWWIAGTSMVATTFAADTPLVITGLVAENGIAGNWLWWNMAASGMVATLFFSRLWRRAEILTDLELIELRYSGKPAAALRGFRALWEGLFLNCIVMTWVILAMTKIISVFFDFAFVQTYLSRFIPSVGTVDPVIFNKWFAIALCFAVAFTYSILSGFWGVVITDFFQFFLAMFGSIMLAVIAVQEIGGISILKLNLTEVYGAGHQVLNFIPQVPSKMMPIVTFISFIAVNWWATKSVDGGAYLAQRNFSAKNERHSFFASLWYCIAHYALRAWPWIIVALISLVVFPGLDDPELGYPKMVLRYLPTGLLGLMLASFLAAFMSTIDTQVNWGSSYVVNDFYKRFINRKASDKHYVLISRLTIILLMIAGGTFAYFTQSVAGLWRTFYALTAGIGGVYIMRWFWWRINAWSEIVAWTSSAVMYVIVTFVIKRVWWPDMEYGWVLIFVASFSTLSWLTATLITKPVDESRLMEFYRRVRPGSPWWGPIARKAADVNVQKLSWHDIGTWLASIIMVYAMLFGIGKILLQNYAIAVIYFIVFIITGFILYRHIVKNV